MNHHSNAVDINEKDPSDVKGTFNRTALHYAAEYDSEDMTDLLLSFGANVMARDRYGHELSCSKWKNQNTAV